MIYIITSAFIVYSRHSFIQHSLFIKELYAPGNVQEGRWIEKEINVIVSILKDFRI